jgi:hypothetical protein
MVQALGMLFWHKHDLDRATQDLANFTPFPDEWSVEDKVLFEQAFQVQYLAFTVYMIYHLSILRFTYCILITGSRYVVQVPFVSARLKY